MAGMLAGSLLFAMLLATPTATATTKTVVYRCVGAHGETVFSGMPCSATEMAVEPGAADDDGHADWLDHCATSANDLRDRVAAAFDSQDVNLLGNLFLWRGISNRVAYRHMRDLRQLVHQPLAGLSIGGAPAWQADSGGYGSLPDDANTWLSLSVAGDDASTQTSVANAPLVEHQYALVERHACVWLSF